MTEQDKYEIPLRPGFYNEGDGPRVIIDGGKVYIVDRTGDKPHDLVRIRGTEIAPLMKILTDHMGSHQMRPFGQLPEKYDEYKE